MKDIAVEYLGGSGFLIGLGDTGMLFDASEHGADRRILPDKQALAAFKRMYVFISHHHDDHFSQSVYDLCGNDAVYIVGFDVPQPHRGVRMSPGEERGFGPVTVKAFGSTDDGVSFLVNYEGIVLFHAGDLNLWHWRDESSITEIEAAEKAFYACVEPIPKQQIDVAFFPVDPRQGSMYDAGAGYFVMTVKPRILVPMHFQGRADVALRFAVTGETNYTHIVTMQEAGDHIDLHIPDTEDSAPDRKLRELLSDETFGNEPQEDAKPEKEEEEGPQA
ncbi:MAG TPA: MBL fold metallo-hydrolase [Candidatus Ventricola gallistercoris]|nr:MBL fold metallo-hydrolase [Candidatus Ventricola gallistercoris]